MKPLARLAGAISSGLLYCSAFPPLDVGPIACVALVPLLMALRGSRPLAAAALGWTAGTVGCTTLVASSVYEAARRYFLLPAAPSIGVALSVPQLYGAPYFALFAVAVRPLLERPRHPVLPVLGIPATWVACEFLRAHLGHGAPWVLLGHSQHRWLALIQIADLAGVYGLSGLLLLANIASLDAFELMRRRRARRASVWSVGITAGATAAALLYGRVQLARWSSPPPAPLRVALVQGNIPDDWRYSLRGFPQTLQRYRDLTDEVGATEPALIVWPENAVTVLASANTGVLATAARGLPPGALLLAGAPRAESGTGTVRLHNSAFLVDGSGATLGVYDKLRLTPYAEYTPWLAPSFLDPGRRGAGRYAPGKAQPLLQVSGRPFAVLICYEAIYPDLARQFVRNGATLLINISNDDWFGQRPAVQQHFVSILFRAVETRRYLLRATNTGVTAVIAPTGVVIARAPTAAATTLSAVVGGSSELSAYVRHGDVFAAGCMALAFGLAVGHRLRARPLP